MTTENRDKARTKRRVRVRYGVEKLDKSGFTMNLSRTGLYIRTNAVFRAGTTLQLELSFPEKTVSLWGKVMWAKKVPPALAHVLPCGMGVRLVDPDDEWDEFFQAWRESLGRPKAP